MKITKRQLRQIIAEEYGNVVTGREKGMSISSQPPGGMTGLEVGDMVYLKHDAYLDADIGKFGDDFPPISVMEIGSHKDLLGMNHKTWAGGGKGMRYSDYDFAAGVGEETAFVGEYQTAPGMPEESLVFPVSAIDWEYTERGPKEIWQWGGPTEKGTYAGGGMGMEITEGVNTIRITKSQVKKIVREARDSMGMSEYGLYEKPGAEVIEAELDALMDEVSEFVKDARQRLNSIIEAGTKFGANDTESLYQIDDAFRKAVLSQL